MLTHAYSRFSVLLAALMLCACAVCEQHPTACKVVAVVGGAVIVGAIAKPGSSNAATRQQVPSTPDCSKPGLCN